MDDMISIYAQWDDMTANEISAQLTDYSLEHGDVGFLCEAYHGEPYATKVLVPEAFEEHRVPIYAATLADRLPAVLAVAEARERDVYRVTDEEHIALVLKNYRDFVALCERKERESGAPCTILAIR
jgi:hypothetical protein